ncbi:TetR/AcrR family transcriptional regulator [Paenibacillaceae bacterium WGS1546]|uniref:TetR/AcrR family transcriptional regulator n=1 Tax=Cohnella sp. WGS1546 TaxID=3366810 RepID=UPI00372D5363
MARPREYSDREIYQAIYSALGKYGYASLTLDNIAREIGISPAALSKRFGSKKNLLLCYMDMVIESTRLAFAERLVLPGPKLETLKSLLVRSLGQVGDAKSLANITSLFIESVSDPDLLERSRIRLQVIGDGVLLFIREAIENGELPNLGSDDAATTARVLQAAIAGSLLIWLNDPATSLESWLDDCFSVVLGPVNNLKE